MYLKMNLEILLMIDVYDQLYKRYVIVLTGIVRSSWRHIMRDLNLENMKRNFHWLRWQKGYIPYSK